MKTISTLSISAFAITAIATVALAGGHGGGLPPEVTARQAHMKLYGFNIGVLGGMAQEKIPYDADAASAAAANLAALAKLDQSSYWTPGTDSESLEGSRALPKIWNEFPAVVEISTKFVAATEAMAAAAGDGLDAVKANIGAVGDGCSDCHEGYRKPKN